MDSWLMPSRKACTQCNWAVSQLRSKFAPGSPVLGSLEEILVHSHNTQHCRMGWEDLGKLLRMANESFLMIPNIFPWIRSR